MNRPNFREEIEYRVRSAPKGSVFITSDFLDIANVPAVNQTLSRLCEDNTVLRRVLRGVYEYPEYSGFLQEYVEVDPHKVAGALARNYGWTIAPSGAAALNLLGLSTQVPATWSYASDGGTKAYTLGCVQLQFHHVTHKEITGLSYASGLVVQAIKAVGRENVDQTIVALRQSLSVEEKNKLLRETQYVTTWVFQAIQRICGEV